MLYCLHVEINESESNNTEHWYTQPLWSDCMYLRRHNSAHTNTRMHTHMHTCTHAHTHTHTHTHTHAHLCAHTQKHTHTQTHTYIQTFSHIHTFKHKQAQIHLHTLQYTQRHWNAPTHIHTHMLTHTHTHTHTLPCKTNSHLTTTKLLSDSTEYILRKYKCKWQRRKQPQNNTNIWLMPTTEPIIFTHCPKVD